MWCGQPLKYRGEGTVEQRENKQRHHPSPEPQWSLIVFHFITYTFPSPPVRVIEQERLSLCLNLLAANEIELTHKLLRATILSS